MTDAFTSSLVLIVEDEPEIADILQAYLEREGLRTARATDGRRALEHHLALKPDLVLLDVQMPLLDGWQVLAAIRQRGDTPVILLTALDQDVDKLTEPFWRANVARTGRSHAGIGLSLAKRLAEILDVGLEFSVEDGTFRARLTFAGP